MKHDEIVSVLQAFYPCGWSLLGEKYEQLEWPNSIGVPKPTLDELKSKLPDAISLKESKIAEIESLPDCSFSSPTVKGLMKLMIKKGYISRDDFK